MSHRPAHPATSDISSHSFTPHNDSDMDGMSPDKMFVNSLLPLVSRLSALLTHGMQLISKVKL